MGKTNADIVRGAAKIIETKGHAKHRYRGTDNSLCAYGALYAAGFERALMQCVGDSPEEAALREVVREQYPERMEDDNFAFLIDFNDHADTTAQELIAVFEKAAAKLEEEG